MCERAPALTFKTMLKLTFIRGAKCWVNTKRRLLRLMNILGLPTRRGSEYVFITCYECHPPLHLASGAASFFPYLAIGMSATTVFDTGHFLALIADAAYRRSCRRVAVDSVARPLVPHLLYLQTPSAATLACKNSSSRMISNSGLFSRYQNTPRQRAFSRQCSYSATIQRPDPARRLRLLQLIESDLRFPGIAQITWVTW